MQKIPRTRITGKISLNPNLRSLQSQGAGYFTRRHAILAGLLVAAVAFVLIVLAFFLYRLGYVDRYIANQIKRTFSNYGIRAEIREFHADIPPDRDDVRR